MATQKNPPGSTRGWTIGTIHGTPVVVAPSWFVAAAVLTWLFAPTVQRQAPGLGAGVYVVALSFVLLLFGSVFLHELAHGLVGRAHGVPVRKYAITLWGGHTEFAGRSGTPGTSALVSFVGPAVNVVLAGVFGLLWQVTPDRGVLALVLLAAAVTNAFVGLFNLLPGLPLDGGRILEAAVWKVTGSRTRGTIAAGWVGRIVAIGAVGWMLGRTVQAGGQISLVDIVWAVMIGSMLWSGAGQAMSGAKQLERLDLLDLATLVRPALAVPMSVSMAEAAQHLGGGGVDQLVLLGPDGAPAGYVDGTAWASVPTEARTRTALTSVAVPLPEEAVLADVRSGSDLVQGAAAAAERSAVLVLVETGVGGGVAGVVRIRDVIAALQA